GLWENVQAALDKRIKATGHQNAYFPLFVPESYLKKEADHVEGFAPEVPWVTHVGEEKLEERLCIRPTSEAIIGATYAKWVQSYRDLPILINQWANVVRWEKRTRLFLRTSEFLWQEGHTCHRTAEEAVEETMKMLRVYHEFLRTELAIPSIMGKKSEKEKFAGAVDTYSVEAMMGDGWALQAGTSHFLGQNFAKAFGIKFLDEDNTEKFVYQTSWGVSTRLIGAAVMVHGDDKGLQLPPRVAPIQAVIVPIIFDATKVATMEACAKIEQELASAEIRVKFDSRDWVSSGFKYNDWELRGVPLRIEVGPKDLEKQQAMLVRRDNREKTPVPLAELAAQVKSKLTAIQSDMLARAETFLTNETRDVGNYDEFKTALEVGKGFIRAPWDGTTETELKIKEETKATIRCIPFEGSELKPGETCIRSGVPAKHRVIFARAY
ncbi:proline--tRNA ligase, partial [Candidatus Sumerlaeota bacterium]|nr:proline--tRNA ligase [Candidatus Sumerlaeota bacterium]